MEDAPLPTSGNENWTEQFDQSLSLQRDRIREFLSAQQERLQRVEAELGEHLQRLAQQLGENRSETQQAKEELQQRHGQILRETEDLQAIKEDLAAKQAQWEQLHQQAESRQQGLLEQIRTQQDELDRRHQELQQRRAEVNDAEAKLHQQRRSLELARGEHQAELEQLAAQRERLDARQAELSEQDEQITTARAEIDGQRCRIEKELEEAGERAELKQQTDAAESRARQLSDELDSLRDRSRQLEQEAARQPADSGVDSEQLDRLEAQRDRLRVELHEARQQLTEAQRRPPDAPQGGTEAGDGQLQRRYEMAMQDLRELKAENDELQQRIANAPAAATPAPAADGGSLDWEAEKQRVLASLEDDFDEEDEEDREERLKIEEVIEKTDRLLADKDLEIEELKKVLESQSDKVGSLAVGAAAFGEMLDGDAIIQEERENLKRMQDEWREKLRKAEIEISIERAKLGRERTELEEKLRTLQQRGGTPLDRDDQPDEPEKPARGRWLSKLGLNTPEEEQP